MAWIHRRTGWARIAMLAVTVVAAGVVTSCSAGGDSPARAAAIRAAAARAAATRASVEAASDSCSTMHWVASFESAPSDSLGLATFEPGVFLTGPGQTFRMIVTPHLGGSTLRVRLSNRFGRGPTTFDDVTIARQAGGAAIVAGTDTPLLFNGQRAVTVPAGRDVVSDPASFSFAAFQNLAVSIYVAHPSGLPTEHFTARQTSYATIPLFGDHSGDVGGGEFSQRTTARMFVTELDVEAPARTGAVVAFGDSITDGYQATATDTEDTSTNNLNDRYPDYLQRRLDAAGIPLSVVNAGISGNRILANGVDPMFGPSGLSRFATDATQIPGATTVIILDGINDIDSDASASQVIGGLTQLVDEAHAAHLKALLGTLTPVTAYQGEAAVGAANEQTREQVNTWIRSQTIADGVIDFDEAVRDPGDLSEQLPAYNGGDGLHFSPAGYQAMANAVPLGDLALTPCASATGGAAHRGQPKHPGHKPAS